MKVTPLKKLQIAQNAFTLAELLIALAILGVIATFTIPKVLIAQQDGKYNAIAKETASMVSGALQAYQQKNALTSAVSSADLTPYMNYVSVSTSGDAIDRGQGDTTTACSATYRCMRLHNGAVLLFTDDDPFSGTASTNALYFYVDPDGQVTDGTANGPGKSVVFFLYTTGRITTWGNLLPGTVNDGGVYAADPSKDPPWFKW
jgi:prepilin-type N-terminal cleavage/methylation domain-containing protein